MISFKSDKQDKSAMENIKWFIVGIVTLKKANANVVMASDKCSNFALTW